MDVPFELHIALRYLLAKRKQAFISVISLISTLGVSVGVMAVIIALAVMTGLQQELRDRILGSNAHVYVFKTNGIADYHAEVDKLLKVPHVVGAAPAINGKALISAARSEQFITVKGIDPALEPTVTDIGRAMQQGSLDALRAPNPDAPDAILLGKDLAAQLGVGIGDSVTLLTPQGTAAFWLTLLALMVKASAFAVPTSVSGPVPDGLLTETFGTGVDTLTVCVPWVAWVGVKVSGSAPGAAL